MGSACTSLIRSLLCSYEQKCLPLFHVGGHRKLSHLDLLAHHSLTSGTHFQKPYIDGRHWRSGKRTVECSQSPHVHFGVSAASSPWELFRLTPRPWRRSDRHEGHASLYFSMAGTRSFFRTGRKVAKPAETSRPRVIPTNSVGEFAGSGSASRTFEAWTRQIRAPDYLRVLSEVLLTQRCFNR